MFFLKDGLKRNLHVYQIIWRKKLTMSWFAVLWSCF